MPDRMIGNCGKVMRAHGRELCKGVAETLANALTSSTCSGKTKMKQTSPNASIWLRDWPQASASRDRRCKQGKQGKQGKRAVCDALLTLEESDRHVVANFPKLLGLPEFKHVPVFLGALALVFQVLSAKQGTNADVFANDLCRVAKRLAGGGIKWQDAMRQIERLVVRDVLETPPLAAGWHYSSWATALLLAFTGYVQQGVTVVGMVQIVPEQLNMHNAVKDILLNHGLVNPDAAIRSALDHRGPDDGASVAPVDSVASVNSVDSVASVASVASEILQSFRNALASSRGVGHRSSNSVDEFRGEGVIVAVIDSGVDVEHPDLKGRMWRNTGEIPGNGIDDDGNGKIDDYLGWNFFGKNNNVTDLMSHGTHVAGIVGAANDGIGVVGMAYEAQIMALKIIENVKVPIYYDTISEAINYAVDNGAHVINLSISMLELYSQSLVIALKYAEQQGVVVVGSSGNDANASPNFPARTPTVISVGSMKNQTHVSAFSNTARSKDAEPTQCGVLAPGALIWSTVPVSQNYYNYTSGTSQAAPFVSGLVARMRSANPDLTPAEVRAILLKTSMPVAATAVETKKEYDTQGRKTEDTPDAILDAVSSFREHGTTVVGKVDLMLANSAISTNGESTTSGVAGVAGVAIALAAAIALCSAAKIIGEASTPH